MVIELKPNWENAPEWANYWAVDKHGGCCWFQEKPNLGKGDFWEPKDDSFYETDRFLENWKDTLEELPLKVTTAQIPLPTDPSPIESKLDRIIELLEYRMLVTTEMKSDVTND